MSTDPLAQFRKAQPKIQNNNQSYSDPLAEFRPKTTPKPTPKKVNPMDLTFHPIVQKYSQSAPATVNGNDDLFNQRAGWLDKAIDKGLGLFLDDEKRKKIRSEVVETSIKPQIKAEEEASNKNIKDFMPIEQKSPFLHNILEQGRSAMTAGAYIPDTKNVSTNNKVLDFTSNLIGQGVGMATGGSYSANNLLKPASNSAEILASKGLSLVKHPKLVSNLLPTVLGSGADFAAQNMMQKTIQGGTLKDTAMSGLEGLGQGALLNVGLRGVSAGAKGLGKIPGAIDDFKTNTKVNAIDQKFGNEFVNKTDLKNVKSAKGMTARINGELVPQEGLLQLPAPRDYTQKVNVLPSGETPIAMKGYKEEQIPKVVVKREKNKSTPMVQRDFETVGNQQVKAYQQENPTVKPFIQQEAQILKGELNRTNPAETIYMKDEKGYIQGVERTQRVTSDSISTIKDLTGKSYEQIEKAIDNIIEDHGKENNALSKKIELIIDDRLTNGYSDDMLGMDIEPNVDYILNKANFDEFTPKVKTTPIFSGYETKRTKVEPTTPMERIDAENLNKVIPIVDNTRVLPQYARENIRKPLELSNPLQQPLKVEGNAKISNIIKPLELANKEAAATVKPIELNTKAQIASKTVKEPFTKAKAIEKANEAYIKTVDDLNRLDQFDKYYEEVTGKKLTADQRSYYQGLNSRGSDMTARNILIENLTDREGNVVGESLKNITKDIPKAKYNDFIDYLVNKHAETRMSRGEKVFDSKLVGEEMTADKSRLIAEQYEKANPEFKKLAERVYNFNNKLGKTWLVDTGIVSPEAWATYLEKNPYYVPNQRLFNSLEKPMFSGTKRGYANQTNPVKKAVGSARKIIDPIETMIEHVDQYVKTAKRNEAMQNVINVLKNAPEEMKGFAEIVPSKEGLVDDINRVLQEEGIGGVLEKFNQPFDKAFQKQNLSAGNIITGLVDGKKVHVKVNDVQFLDALTNLNPQAQNIVIKSLGAVTRVMKTLTTGINPVFSLTRNVFRDIPTAYINSKSTNNPLKFSKDLFNAFVDVVRNSKDYKEYKAIGGGHSSSISSGRKALLESKNSILPGRNTPLRLAQKGVSTLERLNDAVETAPRLAEYKRVNNGDYASKVKGLFEANDVTVNFNKRGEYSKSVDQVIPYFNAAVQGLDKLARTVNFKDNPKEAATTLIKAFSAITVPSIILYTINHDNPNYQKISNSVKDTNFLFPKSDGTFIKIPKPRELGVMFGSDVERAMRDFIDQEPDAWKDFATTIKDSFAPPVRSVLAPFSDLRANKDFANRPIIPGDLEKLSPRLQYDANTSTPAKIIGDKFNISPKKIDFLAKSYGGGLAELGLPALTPNVSLKENLKRKVTVDPVYSNDILRDFYDKKNKLDTGYSDKKHLGGKETEKEKGIRAAFNDANDAISKIRTQIKVAQNDKKLSPSERLNKTRTLQQKINDIANSMNKKYK